MNESDTRSLLIQTATRLFASQGYRGTSVRDITATAGVNLGAVTYHFGSKAALFEEVITRAQSDLVAHLEAAAAVPGDAIERVVAVASAHFHHLADHPDTRRLMMQVLAFERALPSPSHGYLQRAAALVGGLIRQGQAAGQIRPGDPRLLTVSVMAQPVLLNAFRPLLRAGPGVDLDDPHTRDEALANALEFIRAGLSLPPQEVP